MDPERRFRAVFGVAYPALRRYAHHRGISGADAEDLVAEVLTIAWRRLADVPEDDPLPWLFAVAANIGRNRARSASRSRQLVARLRTRAEAVAPPYEPGPVGRGVIHEALHALSSDDQELLRLVAWDGLTPAQVAAVLGCREGAARLRLHRARKRFAAELARRETRCPSATVRERDARPEEATDGR